MKDLIPRLPVEDLLAERYLIAAAALLLFRPGCLWGLSRRTWLNGVALGVTFGVGQVGQALALDHLPSAVSGFAVGCNVVITPILSLLLFKEKVQRRVWAGVLLALAGMTVFTLLRGVEGHAVSVLALGVTLTAAALYAAHALMLGRMSKGPSGYPAYTLTVIQLFTIGLFTGGAAVRDGISVPGSPADWLIMGHLSVVACALGFLARSHAQSHLAAVPSQILMSSQPLWVAVIAVAGFHEQMGWGMVVGGAMMAGAMLLALPSGAVPPGKRRELLSVAGRAARALAEQKTRRGDPLRLEGGTAPYIVRGACTDIRSCPWQTRSLKGGSEPSLERLIDRATRIVRKKSLPGPGCCQSVTLLGRCLCDLMEDSERAHTTGLHRWFRSQ